ncbi:hypothetical protein VTI28DRAFT_9438 [Corynascus sepedonium]
MRLHEPLTLLLTDIATATSTVVSPGSALNITALSSRNGYSVLECWQLGAFPVDYMSAVNYALGNTTVATWSRIEPRTTVGEAWAPHVQLSVVLNGLVRITAPSPGLTTAGTAGTENHGSVCVPDGLLLRTNQVRREQRPETHVAYAMPGTLRSSVLIAADLRSASMIAGHFTEFPSDEPTILVQIPFADDKAPEHAILYSGPCT